MVLKVNNRDFLSRGDSSLIVFSPNKVKLYESKKYNSYNEIEAEFQFFEEFQINRNNTIITILIHFKSEETEKKEEFLNLFKNVLKYTADLDNLFGPLSSLYQVSIAYRIIPREKISIFIG